MKQSILVLLIVALIGGGYLYFSQSNKNVLLPESSVKMSGSSSSSSMTTTDSSTASTEVKTISVEAGSFYYKPSIITVKKGEIVKIVLNSISMMHDFNIDELGVKMPIVKNGDTGTVEFISDKIGTFEYYCSVGQHRANGQVGKLVVE